MVGHQLKRPFVRRKCIGMSTKGIKRDGKVVVPITALRLRCNGAPKFLRRFIQLPRLKETTGAFHALLCAGEFVFVFRHRRECSPSLSFVARKCRKAPQESIVPWDRRSIHLKHAAMGWTNAPLDLLLRPLGGVDRRDVIVHGEITATKT